MKKIRLGLISAGGIMKWCHVPSIANIKDIEIVAICDSNTEAAQSLAKELGVSKVFSGYKELLDCDDIDAVDIATPNYLHSVIAIEAMSKGKHVITEKPDATSVEEAQAMKEASEKYGKVLMPIRNNRFLKSNQFLKKYIADGQMGDIYSAKCGWIRRDFIPGKGGWFTNKKLSGGGPLIDLGVHMIDLATWLMGNPKPVTVSGAAYQKFGELSEEEKANHCIYDVEDLASGYIRFDNGATLQLEFSWASHIEKEHKYLDLLGSKAGASWVEGNPLKIFSTSDGALTDTVPTFYSDVNGHESNFQNFVDVINGRAKQVVTPSQGVDMIKILCGIYESAQSGHEIKLK